MAELGPALIADRFLRNLRLAVLGVLAAVLLCWTLPTMLMFTAVYRPAWLEVASFAVLAAVAGLVAIIVLRGRPWGWLRWPLTLTAVCASAAGTAAVPAADLISSAHWSWEVTGWYAVLLFLDRPVGWLAGVLTGHLGVTALGIVVAGRTDAQVFVAMATVTLVVGGWQLAIGLAAAALRRSASSATRIAAQEEQIRTAEAVADQVHSDRRSRYLDLGTTTTPLLAGLAAGELNPADPAVRRACAIEAGRLRRLFAESDETADPLRHEVQACIDLAERRGIEVQLAVLGERPTVPQPARRALTEPLLAVLARALRTARITLVGLPGQLILSVVAEVAADLGDHDPAELVAGRIAAELVAGRIAAELGADHAAGRMPPGDADHVTVSWLARGTAVWAEATWTEPP